MAEKILSIFIDESGDFGAYELHCPYYLVSMVMHDQRIEIKTILYVLMSIYRDWATPTMQFIPDR